MLPTCSRISRRALGGTAVLCLLAGIAYGQSQRTTLERLGYPADARLLIIHADDLGMSHSVNRATFEALEKGWITSASILVPCPWFPEVARWAQANPDADLGIHLALNSEWTGYRWGPVSPASLVPSLLDEHGYLPLIEPTVVANARLPEVELELRAQIERAQRAGIKISHLDTHMGTLARSAELFQLYLRMGEEYAVPVQFESRAGGRRPPGDPPQEEALIDRVIDIPPGVPAQDWLAHYKSMLQPLPPGVYVLIVHLAYDDEEMRGATWDHPDWGSAWRQRDLGLVRSAEFQSFIREQGFTLVRWRDLAAAARAGGAAP